MGFCCANCGDSEHTCTAWNGQGIPFLGEGSPNHNLVKKCPEDITTCEYRKKKIPSKPLRI